MIVVIDCSHIRRIICPSKENAMAFVNGKQFYSVNVQAVCDSDAFVTNIVARWPGSTHDSRILRTARSQTRDEAIDGILVGDSGWIRL